MLSLVVSGCEQKRCVAATSGHNGAAATGHNDHAPFTAHSRAVVKM